MKSNSLLFIAVLGAATFFSSCKNDKTAAQNTGGQSAATTATDTAIAPIIPAKPGPAEVLAAPVMPAAPTTATKPTEPPQNASGVWHYTCSKGCKGGAGAAQPCAKCGTVLGHNTAYHAAVPGAAPDGVAAKSPATAAPVAKPEPPQNKAGVWHYTCADGCAGGAGAASPCAKCGKTLGHNTAYHQ